MMHNYRFFRILLLFLLFTPVLMMGQKTLLSSDTLVTFSFSSSSDSIQTKKEINYTLDSLGVTVVKELLEWDAVSDNWVYDYRERRRFNKDSTTLNWRQEVWDKEQNDWIPKFNCDYVWDEDGRDIYNIGWTWDTERNDWDGDSWFRYDYDSAGRLSRQEIYYWDYSNLIWRGNLRNEYEYDSAGRVVLYRWYEWVVPDTWREDSYEHYVYELDEEGRVSIKSVIPEHHELPNEKYEYTYNDRGDLASTIKSSLVAEPDSFRQVYKTEYVRSYDLPGTRVETTDFNWNQEWRAEDREVREHDENGNLLLEEEYSWDYNTDDWYGKKKREYSFDEYGNKVLYAHYVWDVMNANWKGTSRFDSFFDENKLIYRSDYSIWNSDSIHWELARVTLFGYLDSGFLSERANYIYYPENDSLSIDQKSFIYPGSYSAIWYDSICEGERYDWRGQQLDVGGSWLENFTSIHGTDSTIALYLKVNPNPASFVFSGASEVVEGQDVLYIAPETMNEEYRWSVSNGLMLSGAQSDTLTVRWENMGVGTVTVWALNEYGCSSDTSSLDVNIGINSIGPHGQDGILLYPVPVKDVLQIESDLDFLEIRVMDLQGCEVIATTGTSVDLSAFKGGIYLVRLSDPSGKLIGTRKILKE